MSRFGKDIEGPKIFFADREARGTVAPYRTTRRIFEQHARPQNVVTQFRGRLRPDPVVTETVARNLVTGPRNAANDLRMSFAHTTQGKERSCDASIFEKRKNMINAARKSGRNPCPVVPRDVRLERGYLKILLDVYRHGIRQGTISIGCRYV